MMAKSISTTICNIIHEWYMQVLKYDGCCFKGGRCSKTWKQLEKLFISVHLTQPGYLTKM